MQDLLKQQFQKSLELTAALTFDWKRTRRELQFAKSMKFLGLRGFLSGIFFWAVPLLLWKIRSPAQTKGGEGVDMFGLYDGLGTETKNKPGIICERFIKKVSQMDGNQLAHFLDDYSIETVGFNVVLTFKIPFRTDSIEAFLCNTKRDGRYVAGHISNA